ncbi:MAG TPA: hypothetical protein VKP11_13020 [Frankiaceae bacterium]|nr:hypothetical protein [Frankiaceae bacterium]
MRKISFLLGFGAGYVLGARAGRERYDSIVRRLRAVSERPEVQQAAGLVTAQAGGLVERVKGSVGSRLSAAVGEPESYVEPAGAHNPNGSGTR